MPAKAGIPLSSRSLAWTLSGAPAFAGVTNKRRLGEVTLHRYGFGQLFGLRL
jgi:hypothetical protein